MELKKIDEELDIALERAWFEKEEKKLQELIKKIDFHAYEINCRKLKMKNKIAQGAFGSVYEGIYGGKKVAVKVFHNAEESKRFSLRRSFVQEICLSKDLDHPNIAKFIGAMENMLEVNIKLKKSQEFDPSLDCCVVTEFLPGGTLNQYIKRHHVKKLPIDIVIQLALDVADGLSYIHSKNIIHRDLKTDNMLLDKNGRVKIIDFGVSKIEDLSQNTQNTGTLGFMAHNSYDHKLLTFSVLEYNVGNLLLAYHSEAMDNPNFTRK
ncbi:hypothetical protein Leryth_025843 [Lithospermum erythrorhizon]|nr:hypothetical protein Leryth_025843 [Lithospermum erythrorhizon]